jgi:hypothetical protein
MDTETEVPCHIQVFYDDLDLIYDYRSCGMSDMRKDPSDSQGYQQSWSQLGAPVDEMEVGATDKGHHLSCLFCSRS